MKVTGSAEQEKKDTMHKLTVDLVMLKAFDLILESRPTIVIWPQPTAVDALAIFCQEILPGKEELLVAGVGDA
jgi:hypothetical protein